jgi:hypothetical protein
VTMTLAGGLSSDSGYFRFGKNVSYGQTSSGSRSSVLTDALHDTAPAVRAEAGALRVSFSPSQAYRMLLDRACRAFARRGDAGLPSGRGGARWRQRSRMTFVHDSERWRIQGQGGERARIARAEIRADQLIYRIELTSPSDTGASGT